LLYIGDKKHRFDNLNLDFNPPPQSSPPSGGAIQSQWSDSNSNENQISKNITINVAGPGIVGTADNNNVRQF